MKEDMVMSIGVIYKNNKRGKVENYLLDDLIKDERIKAFRRTTGWVRIGRDPIRQMWHKDLFNGMERRKRDLPPDFFY
jgi:hypothetical protein